MLHEVIARDHGVGVVLASILLDAGARTDVRDEFLRSTPLGWACRWGRVELVTLLLARGADPIEPEAEPWATPLAWAEARQHAGIASILRRHGADR
jgi:ankyrin repeat protein